MCLLLCPSYLFSAKKLARFMERIIPILYCVYLLCPIYFHISDSMQQGLSNPDLKIIPMQLVDSLQIRLHSIRERACILDKIRRSSIKVQPIPKPFSCVWCDRINRCWKRVSVKKEFDTSIESSLSDDSLYISLHIKVHYEHQNI